LPKQLVPVLALVCFALVACVPPSDEEPIAGAGTDGIGVDLGSGGSVADSSGGSMGLGTGGSASGGAVGTDAGLGPDGSQGSGGRSNSGGAGGTGGRSAGSGGAVGTGGRSAGSGGAVGTGGRSAGSGGAVGTGGAGGVPVIASVCTSTTNYTGGNGPTMRPGGACRGCHAFSVSGTIYPTAHEPSNCNGVNGSTGVRVVITGANGQTLTLTPSAAGNFYSNTAVGASFTAKVTSTAGGSRSMLTMQTSGDCNGCHTQTGASGAPGRIMAP
jgi:hypothetical protein